MKALFARLPWNTWKPKLLDCLPGYDRHTLTSDLIAGITVGVVAVPLAMAFGIASELLVQSAADNDMPATSVGLVVLQPTQKKFSSVVDLPNARSTTP